MTRYLAALIAAVAIGLAMSAGSAQALTFQRGCSRPAFSETADGRWVTSAPFYIHIISRADRYIAVHAGRFEGHPIFPKPRREVPCSVAEGVADQAMMAWEHWSSDTGNVGVRTADVLGRPYLGKFSCTGQTYPTSGRTYETCTHTGPHVGTIVVEFVIRPLG